MQKTPGQRLAEERQARGWSQQRLANELDVEQSSVDRTEKGAIGKFFLPMCIGLDLSAHWVWNETGPRRLSTILAGTKPSGIDADRLAWVLTEFKTAIETATVILPNMTPEHAQAQMIAVCYEKSLEADMKKEPRSLGDMLAGILKRLRA